MYTCTCTCTVHVKSSVCSIIIVDWLPVACLCLFFTVLRSASNHCTCTCESLRNLNSLFLFLPSFSLLPVIFSRYGGPAIDGAKCMYMYMIIISWTVSETTVLCVCARACVVCMRVCACLVLVIFELSQLSRLSSSVAPTQCCGWIPYTHVYMYSTCIYCTCVLSVVLTLALVAVVVRRLPFAVWLELSSPVSSAKRIPAL